MELVQEFEESSSGFLAFCFGFLRSHMKDENSSHKQFSFFFELFFFPGSFLPMHTRSHFLSKSLKSFEWSLYIWKDAVVPLSPTAMALILMHVKERERERSDDHEWSFVCVCVFLGHVDTDDCLSLTPPALTAVALKNMVCVCAFSFAFNFNY